ncbi:hypothetical protein CTEN210_13456 [Chaetoceros tenuissimus]|uniref:Uncharacterized protein n=1 Tax=Chaetoceros tenuissimus TaxID=426638 RepID=A0AAD3D3C7_9STRA|nr:hypothetical protein CTEN210_13456 [Chaetoceros tenuissimus]
MGASKKSKKKSQIILLALLLVFFAVLNLYLSIGYTDNLHLDESIVDSISKFILDPDHHSQQLVFRGDGDEKGEDVFIEEAETNSVDGSASEQIEKEQIEEEEEDIANIDRIDADNDEQNIASFKYSDDWLQNERFSNINEEIATPEYVQNLILSTSPIDTKGSKHILNQSLAIEDSPFITWEKTDARILAQRLIYLALHEHQHAPARKEALSRQKGYNHDILTANKVGVFDYQCDPETKYLVHNHGSRVTGFAYANKGFLNLFLAAISSDRVLLSYKPRRGNWLVSCERSDLQCIFLPFTPCTITKDSLIDSPTKNVTTIDNGQFRTLLANGTLGEEYDDEKILVLPENQSAAQYGNETPHLREKIISIILKLFHRDDIHTTGEARTESTFPWDLSNAELEEAFEIIRHDPFVINQSAWAYLMRPNLKSQSEVKRMLNKAIPHDFDPYSSFGLAVRASDKCSMGEADCLDFDQYMQLVQETSYNRTIARNSHATTNMYDTIVLTSEARDILDARFNYTKNESFLFRFIVNEEDVTQGVGNPRHFKGIDRFNETKKWGADEVLLSSLVTVKMQMLPETLVINGCSNFHRNVLWHFRRMGFTKLKNVHTETLIMNQDPKYRMTCRVGISQF